MPLTVSTKSPTHDLTLTIDDEPVRAHVKRLTKDEGLAFMREFTRFGRQRGSVELAEADRAARETEVLTFIEESIAAYVTFEPGDCLGDDGTIVTGAQIIEAFRFRVDVLSACYQAIYAENCLGKAQKKILNSRRTFSPGSTLPTEPPDGSKPDSTATSAASGSTAPAAAATDSLDGKPSGAAPGKVH
jgi:hypothetical protein